MHMSDYRHSGNILFYYFCGKKCVDINVMHKEVWVKSEIIEIQMLVYNKIIQLVATLSQK